MSVSSIAARAYRVSSKRFLSMSADPNKFPVTEAIKEKLTAAFVPTHLEVINESHKHNVPKDSETHFKVVVVSPQFENAKAPIQRHRLINAALVEQLKGPVHALSIVAKTPEQWQKMVEEGKTVEPSPNCRGGDGTFAS
jgi:BolA protein